MEDIDFSVDFGAGNSNKLQKLGLEGKTSWALNEFTLPNLEIFNSENVKKKKFNVFTLGPTAQDTQVLIKTSGSFSAGNRNITWKVPS